MPVMRMNSSPWLSVSHFSPCTTRFPFGRRSTTVTVMLPSRLLLWLEAPVPWNCCWPSSAFCRTGVPFTVTGRPSSVGPALSTDVSFLVCVEEVLLAWVDSCRRIVSESPTRRALMSSSHATSRPDWKIAPGVASAAGGMAGGGGAGGSDCGASRPQPAASISTTTKPDLATRDSMGSQVVGDVLERLVGRRDRFRIHLVGPLRLDHVDEFLGDVDVRRLELTLQERSEAVQPGRTDLRRTARGG